MFVGIVSFTGSSNHTRITHLNRITGVTGVITHLNRCWNRITHLK